MLINQNDMYRAAEQAQDNHLLEEAGYEPDVGRGKTFRGTVLRRVIDVVIIGLIAFLLFTVVRNKTRGAVIPESAGYATEVHMTP